MTLTEFLNQTDIAALTDEGAKQAANDFTDNWLWRIEGQVRKTQVQTALIINDTFARWDAQLLDGALNEQVKTLVKACKAAFSKLYEPEFYINLNDPTVNGMYNNAVALGVLNDDEAAAVLAAASYSEQPFATVNLHQVKQTRGTLTYASVAVMGNYAVIDVPADVETHNPSLWGQNPRTNKWQVLNVFRNVGTAGKYECQIPAEAINWPLRVDNAYGILA